MKLAQHKLLIFVILVFSLNCSSRMQQAKPWKGSKIKGLSFVASIAPLDTSFNEGMAHLNANALAIMPYAFMPDLHDPSIRFNIAHQWWGETEEGCAATIRLAQQKGYMVMLKPQIWVGNGGFTGHIEMKSEEKWKEWEDNYRSFILLFARMAAEERVDIFCLGTELAKPLKARPVFWKKLIADIREVYSGQLTYAENWDCFDQVPFIDQLDFIGVNAYFPLTTKRNPSIKELKRGWKEPLEKMRNCSVRNQKPILLTEFGYRNMDYAAKEPWRSEPMFEKVNESLQARLFAVCFEEVWSKDWVAGGFIWKWFPNNMNDRRDPSQFTPEGKLAEKTIEAFFKKN